MLPATDADKWAAALAVLFSHLGKEQQLFRWIIAREVNATDTSNTLFRGRSVAIRLVSEWAKQVGRPWLRRMLVPTIFRLMDLPERLEVDPERMADGAPPDAADTARRRLRVEVEAVLEAVRGHADQAPPGIRSVCATFRDVVEAQFPGFSNRAIGGLIFLRLIW